MKLLKNKIRIALILFITSGVLYALHYFFFRDMHHILIYLLGDIAFLPIEVFLVSIVIENFITAREKKERFEKLNMVIETFFSELGKTLLAVCSGVDRNLDQIKAALAFKPAAERINFKTVHKRLAAYKANIDAHSLDLPALCQFLKNKRQFLLGLLQNPNLLEHQSFTETLLTIFHLTEELVARDLGALSQTDISHLQTDAERAYNLLLRQWIRYMEYIQAGYPYLFSFALRTNPFKSE